MKFTQLKMLVSICENNLSVSSAARSLDQAQSSLSKQIQLFEKELGHRIFVRRGKRLVSMTPFGREILNDARSVLMVEDRMFAKAREYSKDAVRGVLRIGTTHLQAKYVLPRVVQQFRRVYPHVFLQMLQSNPGDILQMLVNNRVDLGICTEALSVEGRDLHIERGYRWNRCLVVPQGHPLCSRKRVTLEDLVSYPLITYVHGFTGRAMFDQEFANAGLAHNVVFSAADSDVIKTYVRLGMGVGVIARKSYEPKIDTDLVSKDIGHLFPDMHTLVARRADKYMSPGIVKFIEIFKDQAALIEKSS